MQPTLLSLLRHFAAETPDAPCLAHGKTLLNNIQRFQTNSEFLWIQALYFP